MEVSIIVIAYNEELYIKKCLKGILNQSFANFELIVVDDCSTDGTAQIIKEIRDERIKYIRSEANYGVAISRNTGLKHAKGEYIFFTDADCEPTRHWLGEGLKILKEKKCVGVEGRIFYATARTTISDRMIMEVLSPGSRVTSNIAYTKEILDKVGGFNPAYSYWGEDQDIAYLIEQYGDVLFSEEMIVVHQQKKNTVKKLFQDAQKRPKDVVYFIKNHRDYRHPDIIYWRVAFPKKFLIIVFPFLLLFYHALRRWQDFKLIPFIYLSAVYLRLIIWKNAIRQRIFLL